MFDLDQRLNYFLASAPDATLIVDGTGSIVFASAQVESVFGYEPRRLIGAPIELLMPERFRAGHTSLFKAYFSAPLPRPMGADLRLSGRRQDGSEFPIEISLSPLEDDPNIYVTCAIRDVSDRHKMEAQLRTMASEAERANTVKSRFLAAASHDLRQPLQAATLYLSVLTRQAATPDQQGLCAKMRAPLQVMSGILDALLDISMLDSGLVTPKRSNFALAPILERIAVDLRPVAQQKKLSFDFTQTDLLVNSDPALLERIVENLASNAIRYTTEGSIAVHTQSFGDVVRISVVDTGIGIPEEALERIFDEYFQYDNPARNIKKGLGLGLAIVKRLATLCRLQSLVVGRSLPWSGGARRIVAARLDTYRPSPCPPARVGFSRPRPQGLLYHGGGMMNEPTGSRYVHPAIFAAAPRLHSGMIGPDEFPAILHRKESVLTPGQLQAVAGAGNHVQVNVINNSGGEVTTSKRRQGNVDITDVVIGVVGKHMASGGFDPQLRMRTGTQVQPRGR